MWNIPCCHVSHVLFCHTKDQFESPIGRLLRIVFPLLPCRLLSFRFFSHVARVLQLFLHTACKMLAVFVSFFPKEQLFQNCLHKVFLRFPCVVHSCKDTWFTFSQHHISVVCFWCSAKLSCFNDFIRTCEINLYYLHHLWPYHFEHAQSYLLFAFIF